MNGNLQTCRPELLLIADPFGGMLINVNMKEQASLVVDNTAINSLIIKMTDQLTVGFEVQQGMEYGISSCYDR